jgi:integrase/recombinase XerD
MPYQFKREPLTQDEANRLANACDDTDYREKLIIWTLLGLRVSELAGLKQNNLDWQTHRLTIYGNGGPHGTQPKRRVIPLTSRVQPLIEGHLAWDESPGRSDRTIQRLITRVADRAAVPPRG